MVRGYRTSVDIERNGRPKILPPTNMMPANDGGVDPHVLKAIARAWSWRRNQ